MQYEHCATGDTPFCVKLVISSNNMVAVQTFEMGTITVPFATEYWILYSNNSLEIYKPTACIIKMENNNMMTAQNVSYTWKNSETSHVIFVQTFYKPFFYKAQPFKNQNASYQKWVLLILVQNWKFRTSNVIRYWQWSSDLSSGMYCRVK
jgi:hypothetical protein